MVTATQTGRTKWTQDPAGVQADILAAATQEFADRGLSGARISEIVRKTQTSKRMIYYYFGDKAGLYVRVLEAAYGRVREGENQLDLESLEPMAALARLVEFTFDFHRNNPDYVRLVAIENIHNAAYMEQSDSISKLNMPAITTLEQICKKGIASGQFRADVDPVSLHWLISSACVFNIANRSTFQHLFGDAPFSAAGQEQLRSMVVRAICGGVAS